MKLIRALAVLSTILFLAACSDDPTAVTGVFVDSTVEGLGYECGGDDTRHFTNAAGEFTCNAGDEVRFYLGEILLGSVAVTRGLEVVTPGMLTGASINDMARTGYGENEPSPEVWSSIYMAMILQGLDEDGDAENGIVIPEGAHALFVEPGTWDYDEEAPTPVVDEIFAALMDEEIELPDEEEVFFHLLAEAEKLLHGQYSGTAVEDEGAFQIDLFVFDNPSGGENAEPGLQVRMIVSDEFDPEPIVLDVNEQLVDLNDVLLAVDYSLEGIVIRVYDLEAMMAAQFEPMPDEDGLYDLSHFAPYLIHTIEFEKVVASPDVTMRDVGDFLATLPDGDEVPVDLEEMRRPRVYIGGSIPEPELPPGPPTAVAEMGGMDLWGHTKKLGVEGEFDAFFLPGGHLVLARLSETAMVHRGRIFVVYMDETGPEPEEMATWGDATVTTNVDGSLVLSIDGDDGSTHSATIEVEFAGVGEPF